MKDIPVLYRGIFEKAKTSKATAVKAFCLQCMMYQKEEVRHCTATDCPLYPHRPYKVAKRAVSES